MSKSYLILGGSGFIGKQVIQHISDNDLASLITIADKLPFELSNCTEVQQEIIENQELCNFVQCDLTNKTHLDRLFQTEFDVIINCAGTSELGLDNEIYAKNIVLVTKLTTERAKTAKYVHISDAKIYKASDKNIAENGKISPSTKLAEAHLLAENFVKTVKNHLILRVSNVYGPGDKFSVMPRAVLSCLYQLKIKHEMKIPFSAKCPFATVHVRDVAQFACEGKLQGVYNVSDPGMTTLGDLNTILMEIFTGLKIEFLSAPMNLALKTATKTATEAINQQHMKPWSELCKELKIDTELSPFLPVESLNESNFAIDGKEVEKVSGKAYRHQKISKGLVLEQVNYWRNLNVFPK